MIDYHACVEYLAKYASKAEPHSSVMKSAFNSIVRNCNTDSNPTKLIKKIIMKSLGERDFSAQETMHHLLSLKLVSSSFRAIPISLNGSRKYKQILLKKIFQQVIQYLMFMLNVLSMLKQFPI